MNRVCAKLFYITLLLSLNHFVNAEEVASSTDNPSFQTVPPQSIWSDIGAGTTVLDFRETLLEINEPEKVEKATVDVPGPLRSSTASLVPGAFSSVLGCWAEGEFAFNNECHTCPDGTYWDGDIFSAEPVCLSETKTNSIAATELTLGVCAAGEVFDAGADLFSSADDTCNRCNLGETYQNGRCIAESNLIESNYVSCNGRRTGDTCLYCNGSGEDFRGPDANGYYCFAGYYDGSGIFGTDCNSNGHPDPYNFAVGKCENRRVDHSKSSCPSGTVYSDGVAGIGAGCFSCPEGSSIKYVLGIPDRCEADRAAESRPADALVCPIGEFLDPEYDLNTCYTCDGGLHVIEAGRDQCRAKSVGVSTGEALGYCPAGMTLVNHDIFAGTGECWECDDPDLIRSLDPIDSATACVGFGDGDTSELGYEFTSRLSYKFEVGGGIEIDGGNVDVSYDSGVDIRIEVVDADADLYRLTATERVDDVALDMETTWPGLEIFLTTHTQGEAYLGSRSYYLDELFTQQVNPAEGDEPAVLINLNTNEPGRETGSTGFGIDDTDIIRFRAGAEGLSLIAFDQDISGVLGSFNRTFIRQTAIPGGPLCTSAPLSTTTCAGFVTSEAFMQFPQVSTPPAEGFEGEYVPIEFAGGGMTGIKHYIGPGTRDEESSGFSNDKSRGAKDTDVFRFDFDVDGNFAMSTLFATGIYLDLKGPAPKNRTLVEFSGSAFDMKVGMIMGLRKSIEFKPRMEVKLKFDKLVSVDGELVDEVQIPLESSVEFGHPGGDLNVITSYTLANNLLINDTDLIMDTVVDGEALSVEAKIYPFSKIPGLPNKYAVISKSVGLQPEPTKVLDLNFHDNPFEFDPEEFDKAEFTIGGFTDAPGSTLNVPSPKPSDQDGDGYIDALDDLPRDPTEHLDSDGDGIGDNAESANPLLANDFDNDAVSYLSDNCPLVSNPDQSDVDGDGVGDACDTSDGVSGAPNPVFINFDEAPVVDNKRRYQSVGLVAFGDIANPSFMDFDNGDGVSRIYQSDNAPSPDKVLSSKQASEALLLQITRPGTDIPDFTRSFEFRTVDLTPFDILVRDMAGGEIFPTIRVAKEDGRYRVGISGGEISLVRLSHSSGVLAFVDDVEFHSDDDGDGVSNGQDACPGFDDTADQDGDGIADACDPDIDGDNFSNSLDSFPTDPTEWRDGDNDGTGDNGDNCRFDSNATQEDSDLDGIGDVCDPSVFEPTVVNFDVYPDGTIAVDRDPQGTVPYQTVGITITNPDSNGSNRQPRISEEGNSASLPNVLRERSGTDSQTLIQISDPDGNPDISTRIELTVVDERSNGLHEFELSDENLQRLTEGAFSIRRESVSDDLTLYILEGRIHQILITDADGRPSEFDDLLVHRENDNDGILNVDDNCIDVDNPGQANLDGDALGDLCDPDIDGDGVGNDDDAYPEDQERSEDTVKPTITGPSLIQLTLAPDQAVIDVVFDQYSAVDDVDGIVPVQCGEANQVTFGAGVFYVDCIASDLSGNEAVLTVEVVVIDEAAPILTLPPSVSVNIPSDAATVVPTINVSASDVVDGDVNVDCDTSPLGPGTYQINCSATDESGNEATGTVQVSVFDVTAPVLTMAVNVTIELASEAASIDVTAVGTASDNVDGPITPICQTETLTVGETALECTATDSTGNATTKSTIYSILDITPPLLLVPADVTVEFGDDTSPQSLGFAKADDVVSGSRVPTYTDVDSEGEGKIVRVIQRTWEAFDAAGNGSAQIQTIQVQDTTAPTLVLPANQSLFIGENTAPAATGFAAATDIFDASPVLSFTDSSVSGEGLVKEVITRTWQATDSVGNQASGEQTITVSEADTQPVADIVLQNSAEYVPLSSNLSASVVGGNGPLSYLWTVGEETFTTETIQIDIATPGEYPVQVTVTDVNGDTSSDSITIVANLVPIDGLLEEIALLKVERSNIKAARQLAKQNHQLAVDSLKQDKRTERETNKLYREQIKLVIDELREARKSTQDADQKIDLGDQISYQQSLRQQETIDSLRRTQGLQSQIAVLRAEWQIERHGYVTQMLEINTAIAALLLEIRLRQPNSDAERDLVDQEVFELQSQRRDIQLQRSTLKLETRDAIAAQRVELRIEKLNVKVARGEKSDEIRAVRYERRREKHREARAKLKQEIAVIRAESKALQEASKERQAGIKADIQLIREGLNIAQANAKVNLSTLRDQIRALRQSR